MTMLTPKQVFEEQIDCIRRGEREAQLKLYREDIVYRFPFATDREREIAGKDQFHKVMKPLWEALAASGARIVDVRSEVHQSADDPELIFAEFVFVMRLPDGASGELEFVQKMRVVDGKIASVTEYFSPVTREAMADRN